MTDAFRVTIEELAREHNRQLHEVRETYKKLNDLETVVRSNDGMIGVTVGPQGRVRGIELSPRVYRKLSPSELAHAIMEQIDRATAEVTEQTKELLAPLVPGDLPFEEFFGEAVKLDAFLPQRVEPTE